MTPVLAAWGGAGNVPVAVFIWESVEPLRDDGFKTLSFILLGLWLLWLGYQKPAALVELVSRWLGGFLLLLGFVEAIVPLPLRSQLGETGLLGLALWGLPIWGYLVAHRFWQRELTS
jgi:hypothetical protein